MVQKVRFSVVIPARMASTRLPGKMLADLHGRPLIAHVVDRASESDAARIIVATDNRDIAAAVADSACETVMTSVDHASGSDRLAEVAQKLRFAENEIVVNVQGDEPLVPARLINETAAALSHASDPQTVVATAAKKIDDISLLQDPNTVKVVVNRFGSALYFSRAGIPFARNERTADAWHHIGIYAYRAHFLSTFATLEQSALETCESLEQLRILDHGYKIQVLCFDYDAGFGIDTQADLDRARELLGQRAP